MSTTIELDQDDDAGRRVVHVGDRVRIRLPESPTTGYRWRAESDDALTTLVDDSFDGPGSPRGAGGHRVLVLETVAEGSARLVLVNTRSWSPEPADERFSIDLEIVAP